jgi:hypothetical protein
MEKSFEVTLRLRSAGALMLEAKVGDEVEGDPDAAA